jgi:hypothetical protein
MHLYPARVLEQAMKIREVITPVMSGSINWIQAAELEAAGGSPASVPTQEAFIRNDLNSSPWACFLKTWQQCISSRPDSPAKAGLIQFRMWQEMWEQLAEK